VTGVQTCALPIFTSFTTSLFTSFYLTIFFHNQNHQCELVVCSAAESIYYRPQPKRLTERSPLCTTSTHGFFKNLLFLSFLISLFLKWVVLFEYCQLIVYIIIFKLISYIFLDLIFVSSYCIHKVSSTPKFSVSILIL